MDPGPRALLWLLPLVGVTLYAALVVGMVALERRLVFKPPALGAAELSAAAARVGATELRLHADDGTALYGWRIDRGGPLVLMFSGNASSVGSYDRRYTSFADAGFSVVHVNYRGYPGSAGRPSEAGLRRDALAAWAEARRTHAPQDILVYGKSLGGGVAMALVSSLTEAETPRALLLDSTFSRAVDTAAERYPWLPVRWVMVNQFPSVDRAPAVKCPVVLVHSVDDEVIPHTHSERLFARLERAQLLTLGGLGHNDEALSTPEVAALLRQLAGG